MTMSSIKHELVELRTSGVESIDKITEMVSTICHHVERQENPMIVLLWIEGCARTETWPGEVSINAVSRWERAVRRLEKLSAPIIAAARGTCEGPASDLFFAADYRIAMADLNLVAPSNHGLAWPGMLLFRAVQKLGPLAAGRLILWGRGLDANVCSSTGLIDELTDDLLVSSQAFLLTLGSTPTREVSIRRQLLQEAMSTSYEDALGIHLAACESELRRLNS